MAGGKVLLSSSKGVDNMSKANRKRMYDLLVAQNRLDKDDGALVREFGSPAEPEEPVKRGKKNG